MGMHDHTPIRLPGGTVTSGADLANRGISENQYPSVAEMEISIQDGFKSYGQAYVPPPAVTYQAVLKRAKLSFRLRVLSICGFAFAFVGFLHGKTVIFGAYGLIFSLIMLCAFALYPYLKRPKPWGTQEASDYAKAEGAAKVIIGGMVFIKYLFKAAGFLISIAIIIFAGVVALPISDTAYLPPAPTVDYTVATTNAYGISADKNRIENALALAPLFKPGTNMAHLFSACKIRNCTMPDYEAFESFKRYAVNSSSYFNDICALLAFPDGHAPEISVITPRWDMERFYHQYGTSGVTCRPSESYLMQARAINSAAVDRRNYWLMAIGIPLVLIYIFVVFTTSRWK